MTREPGIHQISNAEYHASPGLSASGMKMLLPPSCPAIYRYRRDNPEHKKVWDFGSAAHKLVLNDADSPVRVVDAPDWRSKAAREERDDARANGETPVLAADWDVVNEMAAVVRAHPVASQLFRPGHGKPEQSLFWTDDKTGTPLRARLDWLPEPDDEGRLILGEYKSARSADPESFSRPAADYGYAIQNAHNVEGARTLTGTDDVALVFVVQAKEPPYPVTVIELDIDSVTAGYRLRRKAIDLYARCTANDHWPAYLDDAVASVSLPPWFTAPLLEESRA